ncbi:MAG: response regulator [Oscillospiraceae bacterium]|nr:response regulator [Oscillospiraceae bacterium]
MDFKMENLTEEKATILVVDDVEINRMILESILSDDYIIEQAADGEEALEILLGGKVRPSLVLLDIMMPKINGYEVLKTMKEHNLTKHIPVIFITAEDSLETEIYGLKIGAIDYIIKPFNENIVKMRVNSQVELARYRENLEAMVNQKVNALIAAKENILSTMASVIEHRSLESGDHVKRTAILTGVIADVLLEKSDFRDEVIAKDRNIMVKAAPLHDVGKIAVPDEILLKPGKLTPEEFAVMETHTSKGSEIIEQLLKDDTGESEDLYLRHCYDICRFHHERWDGKGYPDKISGEAIPLSARIVSIVDVYDALVSKRVYKPAFTHEEALKMITEDAENGKFDMRIVKALFESSDTLKKIYKI